MPCASAQASGLIRSTRLASVKISLLIPSASRLPALDRQARVSILHRTPTQNEGRVQGHLDLPPLEIAGLMSVVQTALEDRLGLVVQDQLGSKELQRAFGKGSRVHLDAQRHLPAQVIVGPRPRFRVRNPIVSLQQKR